MDGSSPVQNSWADLACPELPPVSWLGFKTECLLGVKESMEESEATTDASGDMLSFSPFLGGSWADPGWILGGSWADPGFLTLH